MIASKPVRYCAIALAVMGWLWAMGWVLFLIAVTVEKPEKPDQRTDAIIVLTGGQNRINSGLDLLAAGKAQYLFISGVNKSVTIEQLVRMWDPQFEYIPCCIVLGVAAGNTEGNARESSEWAREQGIQSIRLLTSNYHLPRAWLEFTHALPRRSFIANPIKPTSADYDSKHFMRLSFSEYNKTLLTWARLYLYPWKFRNEPGQ